MSSKKYCQKCGTPTDRLTAKLCDECGNPFTYGTQAATPTPVPAPQAVPRQRPQQRLTRRQQVEMDDAETTEGDDEDSQADASYVPEVDGLHVDIEVHSNRERLGSVAGTAPIGDFKRPPEKVPKNKKAFEKDFLQEWQKEAGTQRRKK